VSFCATVLAVLVGGCGGGGAKSLEKADLIKRADAICTAGQKNLKPPPFNPARPRSSDLPAAAKYFADQLSLFRISATKLRALGRSKQDNEVWQRILAAIDRSNNDLADAVNAAKANDLARFGAALGRASGTGADKLEKQFGLKVCGGG